MPHRATFYKLQCVDPHFTGSFGMYRFENGVSLWVNERKKRSALAGGAAKAVLESCECRITNPSPLDEQDSWIHGRRDWKLTPVVERAEPAKPKPAPTAKSTEKPEAPKNKDVNERMAEIYKRFPLNGAELSKKMRRRVKYAHNLADEIDVSPETVKRWMQKGVPEARLNEVWEVFDKWDKGA